MFLLYNNDIYLSLQKLNFYLFADDTNMLYGYKNVKSLVSPTMFILNWRSLRLVECPRSLVSRHFFGPYLCKMDYSIDIQIFDNYTQISMTSERKDYIKYLGILLNSNLSWKYHAGYIASKISKAVGIIARLRHYVPLIIIIITPYLHHLHITFLVHFFPFSVYYVLLLFIA